MGKSKIPVFVLFSVFFLVSLITNAQVTEESRSMSLGVKNAMVLDLPNTQADFVDKLWKKYIKSYGGKTKRLKGNEYFTDDAEIPEIGGANTVDVYARSEDQGDGSSLAVWVDLGGAFLSSDVDPDRYTEGEKLLMRFALFVAKENTSIELDAEDKALRKLEDLQKKLERDNDRYHREIEQAKEAILQAEANIETNLKEQEETQKQIEIQRSVVEEVKKRLGNLD
jgi:hypothetical protein